MNSNTHTYSNGKGEWSVPRLWKLAKGLPPVLAEPESFREWHEPDFGPTWLVTSSMSEYVGHVRRVLDADLSYPIIVSAEGSIMDGNHRLLKAGLLSVPVLMVKFAETPRPCRRLP